MFEAMAQTRMLRRATSLPPPTLCLLSTRRYAVDSRNRTLRYWVAALRCAAVLVPPVLRALPLVLLEGKDAGMVRCCFVLSFAPAATDGNRYGTIACCTCALVWRMRLAAAKLAGCGRPE